MQKLVFTNGGGNTIDLTSVTNGGYFGITNWEGLSGVGLNIQTQTVPFQDGAVFLDALMNQREITVTVAIQDNNVLEDRYERKRELISALNPKLGEGVLVYTNDYLSRQIKAVPQLPIFENKNSNDSGTLKASVTFSCCSPYWEDLEDTVVEITSTGNNVEVVNNGDIETKVQIEISAGVDTPTIINETQNRGITLNGNYEEPVIVTTETGKKSIIKKSKKWTWAGNGDFTNAVFFNNKFVISGDMNGNLLILNEDYEVEKFVHPDTYVGKLDNVMLIRGYCVVTNGVRIIRTLDLENWEYVATAPYNNLKYVNGVYFSFDGTHSNVFAISKDMINWETVSNSYGYLCDVEFINDKYYLVCSNGLYEGTFLNSLTRTMTWFISNDYGRIIYKDGKAVITAWYDSSYVQHVFVSTDLTSWTDTIINRNVRNLMYDGQKFIILCTAEGVILTSTNGVNWTETTIDNASFLYGGTFVNSNHKGILVGSLGTIVVDKGSGFVTQNRALENYPAGSGSRNNVNSMIHVKRNGLDEYYFTRYVTGGGRGLYKSFDKKVWLYFSNIPSSFRVICENNIILVASGGAGIYRSTDGESFTKVANNVGTIHGLCFDGTRFIAVGNIDSYESILVSTDSTGTSWQKQRVNTPFHEYCNEIIYVNGQYVLVALNGIWTSTNLLDWTHIVTTEKEVSNVKYIPFLNLTIAVGREGLIYISSDLVNWTSVTTGHDDDLRGIGCSDTQILVTSASNRNVYTSFDVFHWTVVPAEVSTLSESVLYDDGEFLLGGIYLMQLVDSDSENIIANLSSNSDMNFGLNVGTNIVKVMANVGDPHIKIRYRQKYIGV